MIISHFQPSILHKLLGFFSTFSTITLIFMLTHNKSFFLIQPCKNNIKKKAGLNGSLSTQNVLSLQFSPAFVTELSQVLGTMETGFAVS